MPIIRFISWLCLTFLFLSETAIAWKMEADKIVVSNTTGGVITHIDFRQVYDTVPLVFTLASDTGVNPAALRIINVTTTGFDIFTVEPDGQDGPHAQMSATPYIAIEAGTHVLPDGTKIVAGAVSTQSFQSRLLSGDSWQSVSLNGFNPNPVVLGQIQTNVNESASAPAAPSKPWMTTKISNVSSSGFDIALERSETTTGAITSNEKIAYLAIDSGLNGANHYFASNDASKIEYESIRTGEVIGGWDDSAAGYVTTFSKTYPSPIVVSKENTRNSDDGGWLRRRSISNSAISLVFDEDFSSDAERSHSELESVGMLLFSDDFDVEFNYSGQAEVVINELMYNESTTGLNNEEFVELYVTKSGDLRGLVITDQDTHFYTFPSQSVNEGDYVIFHTGNGANSSSGGVHHFYQGVSTIWNNPNDDVLILIPSQDVTITSDNKAFNATPYDYIAYGRSSVGGNVDPIPTSMMSATISWNYSFGTELKNAADGESISLSPNAMDSDKAACWERTNSGNASNNSCTAYTITVDTDSSLFVNSEAKSNTSAPIISLQKSVLTIYDPYNGASNPKAIPGAVLEYIITAVNSGDIAADNNSIVITDSIPFNTKLCVSDIGSCKVPYFVDDLPLSNLSLSGLVYSGASYADPPSPDAEGSDDRVSMLQASFSGAFPANTDFQLRFRVIVE